MIRNKLMAVALLGLLASPGIAAAQQWPSRPIRMIVPFSAGGPTDLLGRYAAKELSKSLGQPVVVENVLGASGSIGLNRLANSTPDGYTIGITANTVQALAPHLSKLPYDTLKDFAGLGGLAGFPYALVTSINSPFHSVQDIIDRAKAAPGTVVAGSAGVGTGTALSIALLNQRAGVSFNDVNYKGSGPVVQDIIGGNVDFTFDIIGTAVPMAKAGMVRVIATTGPGRHRLLPDVPTVGETLAGYEFSAWYALIGPAGMPPEVVQRLSDAIVAIQQSKETRSFLEERGYDPMVATSGQLDRKFQSEYQSWGEVVSHMKKE